MKTQGPFQIASPAKVTLHLRILRRLSDGYHAVRIAQAPVTLYDQLRLRLGGPAGIALQVESPQLLGPPEENLVHRAARAFAGAMGAPVGAQVQLMKHIPAGAGLGGGSGNAAATLMALERWYGHPIGMGRLQGLARGLGADVPFFIDPRPAWSEGVGEQMRPLAPLPPLELLVIKPPLSIGTVAAYAAVQPEAGGGPKPTRAWDGSSVASVAHGLFNAFEAALLPRYPLLGDLKEALLAAGALGALLSGSGSAVFGVFADAAARDAATALLRSRADTEDWTLLPCRTLHAHRYDFVF